MNACAKCGSAIGVAPQWVLFVHLRPPSQNDNVDRAGGGRFAFRKLRESWVRAIRHAMNDTGGGRFEIVPRATGKRRIVLTRLYCGREQERDYGNLVGGMKLIVDAMQPPRQRKLATGKRKGQEITVDGAGLILDDSPELLDDVYLQVRTDDRSGLRIEIADIGPPIAISAKHHQLDLSQASATLAEEGCST